MLTLYLKPSCQYCARVLRFVSEHNVPVTEKNISSDQNLATELIALGGKRQVPYLVDDEAKVAMYESADIIEYIKSHYVH